MAGRRPWQAIVDAALHTGGGGVAVQDDGPVPGGDLWEQARALDLAPVSILVHALDGEILYANERSLELTGYAREQFVGRTVLDIESPESAALHAERMAKVCEQGEASFEVHDVRRDGTVVPLEVHARLGRWGDRPAVISVATDVSDRKMAEQIRRESERRYRLLADHTDDLVTLNTVDGERLYVSPSVERRLGWSAAEFRELDGEALTHPDDHERFARARADCLRGEPTQVEFRYRCRDGHYLWLETTFSPVFGPDGTVHQILHTSRDVTERKRGEEQLRDAVAMREKIIDTAATAIFAVDPQKRITDANEAFCAAVGRSREAVVGQPCSILASAACAASCGLFDDGGTERIFRRACEIHARDGRRLSVIKNATLVRDRDGRITGGIESFVDVTELTAAREEAERASQAKSDFLANMSHEIRTPMTAILGFAEAAMDAHPARGTEAEAELHDQLDIIVQNGRYLLNVINDILDLSKIEAGKLETKLIACSPCEIVGQVETLIRGRADAKGLALTVGCQGRIPETIRTDPTRLRQVLINLLGNAVKFTEEGQVGLTARLGTLPGGEPALEFDVTDTGVGMTADQTERLFHPFTQADSSTTRMFGGTGLGLAISKRLAVALGGDLRVVETRPGGGTRFRLTVATGPLDGVRLVDHVGGSPRSADGPGDGAAIDTTPLECRILVAEDNPVNQRLVEHLLKKAGATVTVVDNGRVALDAALTARDAGVPYDVILMDMQMPVMDGYSAATALREIGYSGAIVALTAHAMASDRKRCLDAGCDDHASKPIDRRKLVATIRRCLSS